MARSKYHARPTAGHASRREARRAAELHLLASRRLITDLREQVSFTLIPAQRDPATGQLLERSLRYVADFVYSDPESGATVVEDCKGMRTREYIIKRKLMLFLHNIRIKET